jgi:hypothetical protein
VCLIGDQPFAWPLFPDSSVQAVQNLTHSRIPSHCNRSTLLVLFNDALRTTETAATFKVIITTPVLLLTDEQTKAIQRWYSAGLRAGWSGVRVSAETAGSFPLHHRIRTGCGAHPASYPMGTSERPWREADHSLPSSVEVKNAWSYTSTSPISLHGMVFS